MRTSRCKVVKATRRNQVITSHLTSRLETLKGFLVHDGKAADAPNCAHVRGVLFVTSQRRTSQI